MKKKFTILMYEDEIDFKKGFEYNHEAVFAAAGVELVIIHKLDGDSLDQDLISCQPNLIMVDHDLGEITGDSIIEIIDGMPEYAKTSIYYYSGGESITDLRDRASKHKCHILCFTKTDEDLDTAIHKLAGIR